MKIYNTLTKKVEEFVPNNKDIITMYTCGPTVYHYAHIGNLRTYIFEDILEKSLTYLGYNVKRCMNITDVGHLTSDADTGEDKMLKGAKREKKSVLDIAKFYTEAFKNDTSRLNIKWPEIVSCATDNIPKYIEMIEDLLSKNYAYVSEGNVYFDTSKLDNYYQLTNQTDKDLAQAVRADVSVDQAKKNQTDFVLWFTKSKFDDQELKWDSPWGVGYPGWHIECSAISLTYLGEHLDIHCGGVDNIFPHHTNEIAQSESYLGHKWCNYWIHGEHLNDKDGKMSKSNGEFLTLSLLEEKGYNPLAYRFMCLNTSYRKVLTFTYEALDNAQKSYQKLKNKMGTLQEDGALNSSKYTEYDNKFKEYISDDLNTSNAISLIYDLLKAEISGTTKLALIKNWDKVLSLDLTKKEIKSSHHDEEYIKQMIAKRNEAKANKDYKLADEIRDTLLEEGIILKDTREGTIFEIN